MAKSKTSSSSSSISGKTFTALGNLIKLLPTGTVFIFQFLNPVLTNNGHCSPVNKFFTSILIGLCGFSCAFSCFTDSYTGSDGMVHYGIATVNGFWPSSDKGPSNKSSYKLRIGDFVHAFFSVIVFAVLSLLDSNTVRCFYPAFESTENALLMVLPPVIGAISGAVFMTFPDTRHGIGYRSSDSSNSNSDDSPNK
ncbi:protein DMP2-like [Durio zibethinus]|uniref:Protein DMP2-like n=1 Tax=Durio zibethinus TaxID=66656 RepID=A0A6P5X220_DURZI|nr:protein DMP2-like [Durio zibethinus]